MDTPRKRIRRSAPASKLAILEAAEARLAAGGPDAVRVQPIAHELGLTDAAVHYHFGSREKLLEALLRFSGRRFLENMAAALAAEAGEAFDLGRAAALLQDYYGRQGAARLAMWLHFSGWRPEGAGMLDPLVDALHAARTAKAAAAGGDPPSREESRYAVALLSSALFTQALSGDATLRSVGLDGGRTDAFNAWLVGLVSRG
jgi:AcrR family transcriptional regulator